MVATDNAAINVYFDRHFPNAVRLLLKQQFKPQQRSRVINAKWDNCLQIATAEAFRQQDGRANYKWMTHVRLLLCRSDWSVMNVSLTHPSWLAAGLACIPLL